MDQFISSYTAVTTAATTAFQRIGLLSIPIGIAVLVLTNLFGGERAIGRVGIGFAVLIGLVLILNNAVAFGTWVGSFGGGAH